MVPEISLFSDGGGVGSRLRTYGEISAAAPDAIPDAAMMPLSLVNPLLPVESPVTLGTGNITLSQSGAPVPPGPVPSNPMPKFFKSPAFIAGGVVVVLVGSWLLWRKGRNAGD